MVLKTKIDARQAAMEALAEDAEHLRQRCGVWALCRGLWRLHPLPLSSRWCDFPAEASRQWGQAVAEFYRLQPCGSGWRRSWGCDNWFRYQELVAIDQALIDGSYADGFAQAAHVLAPPCLPNYQLRSMDLLKDLMAPQRFIPKHFFKSPIRRNGWKPSKNRKWYAAVDPGLQRIARKYIEPNGG
jgi:hypothetical protein